MPRPGLLLITMACFSLSAPTARDAEAKFEPPKGRTLVFIGQDLDTIQAYADAVGPPPDGVMLYTSVQKLEGLTEQIDIGSGPMDGAELHRRFPTAALQIGLYMVDALEPMAAGAYDEHLDQLADWIRASGVPVFLRVGYECDGPHNHYDPAAYVRAYRYLVDRFRARGVANAAYVWHAYGGAPAAQPLQAWYPGDDYVDWVGVSYFDQPQDLMEPAVALAQAHGKPVMLAEATPRGTVPGDGALTWQAWFDDLFAFIERHDINALCYINSNWDSQPMWRGQGWGDARIQADPAVQAAWIAELRKPRYQPRTSGH